MSVRRQILLAFILYQIPLEVQEAVAAPLESALQMAGMDFNGRAHDALDDARNTAELLHVFNDSELFNSTLRKIEELMKPSASGCALGELIDFSALIPV